MTAQAAPAMRFSVDEWDPAYGSSLDLDDYLAESTARVDPNVEVPASQWQPVNADPGRALPGALLFLDGVRRIEARVWVDDELASSTASLALCASYAAGVVCCCAGQAHVVMAQTRRGLFTIAPHATGIVTWAGEYAACRTTADHRLPLPVTLSKELQIELGNVEVAVAVSVRDSMAGHGGAAGDLLVLDGPLRGRQHLPRTIGYIKAHHNRYLPPDLNAMVGTLKTGQRTPVFLAGSSWDRHTWYLRLPAAAGAPWAGIVRIECSADLPTAEVIELADLSQLCLGRFASAEYKDSRAPQNLYPIAGLERELRHRLGDPTLLYRALRLAADAAESPPGPVAVGEREVFGMPLAEERKR